MAQKVTVELEDDLSGGPADETLRFGLDGTEYEIDLNQKTPGPFGRSSRRSSSTLARLAAHRDAGRRGPRRAGSAVARSGPGRMTAASRSALAAVSPLACWSSIRLPPKDLESGGGPQPAACARVVLR
jgi:hypothetical protein